MVKKFYLVESKWKRLAKMKMVPMFPYLDSDTGIVVNDIRS